MYHHLSEDSAGMITQSQPQVLFSISDVSTTGMEVMSNERVSVCRCVGVSLETCWPWAPWQGGCEDPVLLDPVPLTPLPSAVDSSLSVRDGSSLINPFPWLE